MKLPAEVNEFVAIVPETEIVFLKTLTLVVFEAFAISGWPSPSKSATAIISPISYQLDAPAAEAILTGARNEFALTVKLDMVEFVTLKGILLCVTKPDVVFTTEIGS